MSKETSLSEKICVSLTGDKIIHSKDVREAVLRLKEWLNARSHLDIGTRAITLTLIDEIFGDKLTQSKLTGGKTNE